MSNQTKNPNTEQQKNDDALKPDLGVSIGSLKSFFKKVVNIGEGVDIVSTMNEIQKNIHFSGYNIWILVCSIAIASVGLISNSPAVIIGAMLISPLMGPIRGIGLAAGVNDLKLLMDSLRNFGIMVAVSLTAAFIFFLINPLKTETPELLARTKPHILDVIVAFSGGIAGIVAATRKDIAVVIPGVAIATALMPPLCTAGYGLAMGEMEYFFGAFYLFLLNSLFICLSTILIVKYLRFPLVSYLNPKKQKRVQMYITFFLLIIIIPSAFKFVTIIKESMFLARSETFVESVIKPQQGDAYLSDMKFNYDGDPPTIELSFIGKTIPKDDIEKWRNRLKDFNLENVVLKVYQNESAGGNVLNTEYLLESQKLTQKNIEELNEKLLESNRLLLEAERNVKRLSKYNTDIFRLDEKIDFAFPELISYYYSTAIKSNLNGKKDTLVTVIAVWLPQDANNEVLRENLEKWLKIELNHIEVQVISIADEKENE